jgi:hypothetical protein
MSFFTPFAFIKTTIPPPTQYAYVGGVWQTIGGVSRPYIARLDLEDGSVNLDFNAGYGQDTGLSNVYNINAQYPYVYFSGTGQGDDLDPYAGRFDLTGSIDNNFKNQPTCNPGYTNIWENVSGSTDLYFYGENNGYYVNGWGVGSFNIIPGLVRMNSSGAIDAAYSASIGTGFNTARTPPTVAYINKLFQQPDGKVIAWGNFQRFQSTVVGAICRLNTDGTLDTSYNVNNGFSNGGNFNTQFGSNPNGADYDPTTNSTYVLYNSSVITTYSGSAISGNVIKITSSGSRDTTFPSGSGFSSKPTTLTVQPDGKTLYFFRSPLTYNGTPLTGSVRLNINGTIDNTWNFPSASYNNITWIKADVPNNGSNKVYAMASESLYRFDISGSVDSSWTPLAISGNNTGIGPFTAQMFDFSIG